MAVSRSSLEIEWLRPDLDEEQWEFFRHPEKQPFYLKHAVGWPDIVSSFAKGEFVPYQRSGMLDGIEVSLSYHRYEDYARYLAKAKRGYRLSYAKMEDELHRTGRLALKAPTILARGAEGLLFAGYRRLCLAWNHGMTPHVWLVRLPLNANNTLDAGEKE